MELRAALDSVEAVWSLKQNDLIAQHAWKELADVNGDLALLRAALKAQDMHGSADAQQTNSTLEDTLALMRRLQAVNHLKDVVELQCGIDALEKQEAARTTKRQRVQLNY